MTIKDSLERIVREADGLGAGSCPPAPHACPACEIKHLAEELLSLPEVACYLQEDDPPADHDLKRFSCVCGKCYGALADMEREAREECARLRAILRPVDGSIVCTPSVLIDDIIAAHEALGSLGFVDWPNERELTLSERIREPRPCPLAGEVRLCILCAYEKPWGVFDSKTGAAVCVECRDKVRGR